MYLTTYFVTFCIYVFTALQLFEVDILMFLLSTMYMKLTNLSVKYLCNSSYEIRFCESWNLAQSELLIFVKYNEDNHYFSVIHR